MNEYSDVMSAEYNTFLPFSTPKYKNDVLKVSLSLASVNTKGLRFNLFGC